MEQNQSERIDACMEGIAHNDLRDMLVCIAQRKWSDGRHQHFIFDCGPDWFTFSILWEGHSYTIRLTREFRLQRFSFLLTEFVEVKDFNEKCAKYVLELANETDIPVIPTQYEENGRKFIQLRTDIDISPNSASNQNKISDVLLYIDDFIRNDTPDEFKHRYMQWLYPPETPGTASPDDKKE